MAGTSPVPRSCTSRSPLVSKYVTISIGSSGSPASSDSMSGTSLDVDPQVPDNEPEPVAAPDADGGLGLLRRDGPSLEHRQRFRPQTFEQGRKLSSLEN